MGSTGPADAATESFMRYLAAEVGPQWAGQPICRAAAGPGGR